MSAKVFAGQPACAELLGPRPDFVLIPFNNRDYVFEVGSGPVSIPDDLISFVSALKNSRGEPAFKITGLPALICAEETELGRRLVINL